MSELALQLIQENKKAQDKRLDLGNCGFIHVPEEIGDCVWLEWLNFSAEWYEDKNWHESKNKGEKNALKNLPDSFSKLKALKTLYITHYSRRGSNEIIEFSDLSPISGLLNLQSLYFSRTRVADLSPISGLQNLQSLYFDRTRVADLSPISGLQNLQHLDFSATRVADLSPIFGLQNLQSLNFSQTRVADLSPISGLLNLQSLYFGQTRVVDLSLLSDLTNLKSLFFGETQVSDLSPVSAMTNLQSLFFWQTKVADLSPISGLQSLQSLYFDQTQVADLSPISAMTNLRTLEFSQTQVADLSPLSGLQNLQHLDFSGTQVADLSPLSDLQNLQFLHFNRTQVADLSPIIGQIKKGIYLQMNDCPIIIPPAEFTEDGRDSMLEYFDQTKKGAKPLNEIKVIFLGEGASGKTSLIKVLRGEQFNSKEDQTHGIRIRQTPFLVGDETIHAHLWDFGGQEVMHATHQFFMSERCIYVLVLDSRKDEKAEYWLKHAQSFGGDSPVLVVLNKIDENPAFEVNRKMLREKYPQVKDFFKISCKSSKGIEAFRETLVEQVEQSRTRRTPFPITWLGVKEHFSNMEKDYIESAEYREVCKKKKVNKKRSQEVLLQFLHDLGLIINFRNLKHFDTQILNPLWLTNGVYRIINSELVVANKGLLRENDFDAVINDLRYKPGNTTDRHFEYPANKLHYIVRVMQEFELCYMLNENTYVVPQLLPVDEPDLPFAGPVLHFVVQFKDFLPDSVFPRLMVNLHRFIDGELRWRTGMILSKPNVFDARARVRADKEDKRIQIDVCGGERRRFLSFIRETLKDIIAGFANMPISEMVPVPGTNEFKEYQELVNMEKAGEEGVFVSELMRRVPIKDLLDGVEEPSMRSKEDQLPLQVFISYSHKDLDHLKELRAALSPLERLNKLSIWDDRSIEAGKEWERDIFDHLEKADIVLFLLSADSIQSDFCYSKELAAAMEKRKEGKEVLAVQLRSCAWEGLPIAQLQALPGHWINSSNNKDESWTAVAKGLEPVVKRAKGVKLARGRRVAFEL